MENQKERVAITEYQLEYSEKMNWCLVNAVKSWTLYNNSGGRVKDRSDYWYNKLEQTAQEIAVVKLDRGVGLYPTFQINIDGKIYTEYDIESFFKRINGFWD